MRLSTTSYSVLGMLALRPWTPYELTAQWRRSLRYCWPRSERSLYSEPERLVRAGLAHVEVDREGRRERRSYRITTTGRRTLRQWLGTPPAPPQLEVEPLLRVLFADQADVEDLRATLTETRAGIARLRSEGAAQIAPYLSDDGGPFPDRAHIVALVADFLHRVYDAVDDWAADAQREVAAWPCTAGVGMTGTARRQLQAVLDAVEEHAQA